MADFFARADAIAPWADGWIEALAGSGQRWPLTLRAAPSRTALSSLSFSFTLICTRHRRVSYRMSPGRGHISWRLAASHGMGFDDTFRDTTGEHYVVKGTFDSSGSATGFITTTWPPFRDVPEW